ncbi:bifunctional (p)ppGpp synthetase/guanosine-3',5'-bis(diphosphate) 3'-pyrophosphohydrolase [Mesosutterella sp. AGMB02718]|uniref:Bifunctional (P)ppGpp synthetase/guanosine-3',5'-bis(Diphosphate) 3'-pyrophosphohydrolase n=1 Tax=Mesosutterella faecium TaxID=2925194 RepID=A0ABT7ILB0_9BURK|nr:bifunctional (p)ppGpp synthetase/guanosine-3',5'-bis(diphosphate) 3'-pyrophosphohydrolase [Mesosutterella sp. AGMB02718]MDL2059158.1 bifunctional (p)ppGpp synthetase/guanosine-3',5'-bis(diphosphate) 3'-pyrophosphohydrolase [Mesosutterella sp. AGMB02718]
MTEQKAADIRSRSMETEQEPEQDDLPLYMRPAEVKIVSANDLLNRCRLYLSETDCQTILRAYRYADEHHLGQFRKSGEPYITHPLAVASILASWHMDCVTIQAGLMHDVLEDTGVSKKEMAELFGIEVANVVDGVSKLDKLKFRSVQTAAAESFRKLLLAMAKDVRVILVKLADRVHNMRTLGIMRFEKRCRISRETLDIYVPIAHRLGMNHVFRELQELAFLNMHPVRYRVLHDAVLKTREKRKEILERILQETRRALPKAGIRARVLGRDKTLYGIYNTMRDKHIGFREALDIYGFRVIVKTREECYLTLGVLHALYKPVPGRFKDFIAIPKTNGYQSIHTTVIGPNGTPIEYQIRTEEMHRIAEYGILTHWLFNDDGASANEIQARTTAWLQSLLEIQRQSTDSSEFIENIKIDLFPDRIYVFTPKSKIISLPKRSTPIDFAYQIHTDVGNHAAACRINGVESELTQELHNGDMVEITTDPSATPRPEWVKAVGSGKARAEIRQFLRTMKFADSAKLGFDLLKKAGEDISLDIEQIPPAIWESIQKEMGASSRDEFLADLGLGKYVAEAVVNRLAVLMNTRESLEEGQSTVLQKTVEVTGNEGMAVTLASCCHPIPGDEIWGFMRPGKGLSIHRTECSHTVKGKASDPGRWMTAKWAAVPASARFRVPVDITAVNERATVAACITAAAEENSSIVGLTVDQGSGSTCYLHLMVMVHDRLHLARVIRRLSHVKDIQEVRRRTSEHFKGPAAEAAEGQKSSLTSQLNSEDLYADRSGQ